MIKVAIADDHQLFRKSLTMLLGTFESISVIIEAEGGNMLMEALRFEQPDVLLLDLQMPGMDGFETCKKVQQHYPGIKILIVSQLTTKESIHQIMRLGAHGYFTKNSDPEQLEMAIKGLHQNGYHFGMELGGVLREAVLWQKSSDIKVTNSGIVLSRRELEIIRMAGMEMSSAEIATQLHINIRTVETHRMRIMERTNSKNFIGAILFALQNGYLQMEDFLIHKDCT